MEKKVHYSGEKTEENKKENNMNKFRNMFLKRLGSMVSKRKCLDLMVLLTWLKKPRSLVKPLDLFLRAIAIVTPVAKLKKITISGKVYSVGYPTSLEKRQLLAFTFIKKGAISQDGKTFLRKIFNEIESILGTSFSTAEKLKKDINRKLSQQDHSYEKKGKRRNTYDKEFFF